MKIYFAGSIRAGRQDADLYSQILEALSNYGTLLTDHVGNPSLPVWGEEGLSDEYIYERDMTWLNESDAIVAEVTTPSLGVGYELATAETKGKRILCLYRHQPGKRLSAIISGNKYFVLREYQTVDDLKDIFSNFFGKAA